MVFDISNHDERTDDMDPPRTDADDTRVGADTRPPPTPTDDALADVFWEKLPPDLHLHVHQRLRTVERAERKNTEGRYTLTVLLILIFLLQLVTLYLAVQK